MFTTITNWFGSLDATMQVFWACAIAASVVFVIQNALMLLGIGDMDSDVDADVSTDFDVHTDLDGDGVGDSDISSGHTGHEGTLGSAGIFSLFSLRNFINFFLGFGWGGISLAPVVKSQTLLIFLSFLIGLASSGKVQISINGSVHEITAFTDGEALPTGSRVTVVKVIDSGSLLVERILNS